MKNFIYIFLLMLTACQACQKTEQVDTQAELYCRYDENERKLSAEATFFDIGSTSGRTSKVFQNGVAFINSGMRTATLPGGLVRYSYSARGSLPVETYFSWKKEGGNRVRIDVEISKVDNFSIKNQMMSKTDGFQFNFKGSPLATTEKLVLVIVDSKNTGLSLEFDGPSEDANFDVSPDQLASLNPGRCQVDIVRTQNIQYLQAGNQLSVTSEYYAEPVFVELKE